MSFSNLKRNRTSIAALVEAAEAASNRKGKRAPDERFWKATVDKSSKGSAVIRFMPAPEGEDLPWVQYWDHGFQGPSGLWYIENSLTSLGQEDPVSEYNKTLWNSGREEDKKTASRQKRRLHYVANILVVKDPANPENNGKVFLYKFGKKIFDKIMEKMQPEFADIDPVNPFDFWEGANFNLRVRAVDNFINYDASSFDEQKALYEDDDMLENIYKTLYSLREFTDVSNYKTYAELEARLNKVIGVEAVMNTGNARTRVDLETREPAPRISLPEDVNDIEDNDIGMPSVTADGDEDDTMAFFAKLAANDD